MNALTQLLIAAMVIMSVVSFALYGIDKRKAQRGKWRISEKTLLLSALLMGGPGALLGMKHFRHKTKHLSFKILVPLFCILNIALICAAAGWA